MISIYSLTEKLLPNVYIKNLSLVTEYKTEIKPKRLESKGYQAPANEYERYSVPSNTMTAKITMSSKF